MTADDFSTPIEPTDKNDVNRCVRLMYDRALFLFAHFDEAERREQAAKIAKRALDKWEEQFKLRPPSDAEALLELVGNNVNPDEYDAPVVITISPERFTREDGEDMRNREGTFYSDDRHIKVRFTAPGGRRTRKTALERLGDILTGRVTDVRATMADQNAAAQRFTEAKARDDAARLAEARNKPS